MIKYEFSPERTRRAHMIKTGFSKGFESDPQKVKKSDEPMELPWFHGLTSFQGHIGLAILPVCFPLTSKGLKTDKCKAVFRCTKLKVEKAWYFPSVLQ